MRLGVRSWLKIAVFVTEVNSQTGREAVTAHQRLNKDKNSSNIDSKNKFPDWLIIFKRSIASEEKYNSQKGLE